MDTKKPAQPSATEGIVESNYVDRTISRMNFLPPLSVANFFGRIQWISTLAITIPPIIALWGVFNLTLSRKTLIWSIIYYFITGFGITAGYHRLWAHRSYNASRPLEYFLACAGAGSVQGSIRWWSRGHRAHHRYTDTQLDPYSANEGFLWAHLGWIVFKPRGRIGTVDVSDLSRNEVVMWQHRHYVTLLLSMALVFPTLVAGLGWGDWAGGFVFAGCARLVFVHHSTFAVNSVAHWLGEQTFDNKHTPRDHLITALVTVGEGYHNFHHQFPADYRNAIKWFQYDPTKWFIWTMSQLGLASQLNKFPENEIRKGIYAMQLEKLEAENRDLEWPKSTELPLMTWDEFRAGAKDRALIAVHGYIHDCTDFVASHPGGPGLVKHAIGTDATAAFFGGVYDHSNAAHNLLAMMRVGILDGGMEIIDEDTVAADAAGALSTPSSAPSSAPSSVPSSPFTEPDLDYDTIITLVERPHARPRHQPAAQVPCPYTLGVPPSEKLRVIQAKRDLRPSVARSAPASAAVSRIPSVVL